MLDHTKIKLGKQSPRHDNRTLQLLAYTHHDLPAPPAHSNWSLKVPSWTMMRNDSLGDCTAAAAGHMIETWTANTGTAIVPSDDDIVKAYEAVSGYNPATGANDNGAVVLDVLKYWRKVGVAGHRIGGFASVEPGDRQGVKDSIWMFGGAYLGVALPLSAQNQQTWSVPAGGTHGRGAPGSWGGHAIPVIAYDSRSLTCVTWGHLVKMSWGFFETYCDEAYAVLSKDWLSNNKCPSGFDLATLQVDLSII